MKVFKKAFALLLTAGLVHSSFAQLKTKVGIRANYIGAYNSIDFNNSSNATLSLRSGWGFGSFLDIPFNQKWGVEASLNYATLGTKISGYFLNANYSSKQSIRYNYLTLPILARYTFAGSNLSLLAGPQVSLLLSASRLNTSGDKTNIKSYFKSNDLAGVGGLDYKLPLKDFGHEIHIGARYQMGLTDIIKTSTSNSSNKMYNNAIYGSVSYVF